MRLRLAILGLLVLASCGQAAPGKPADTGQQAERGHAGPCADKSKRLDEDADRPETWTRSDYDQCMVKEANKTQPADESLCRAGSGEMLQDGRCVLVIL